MLIMLQNTYDQFLTSYWLLLLPAVNFLYYHLCFIFYRKTKRHSHEKGATYFC